MNSSCCLLVYVRQIFGSKVEISTHLGVDGQVEPKAKGTKGSGKGPKTGAATKAGGAEPTDKVVVTKSRAERSLVIQVVQVGRWLFQAKDC